MLRLLVLVMTLVRACDDATQTVVEHTVRSPPRVSVTIEIEPPFPSRTTPSPILPAPGPSLAERCLAGDMLACERKRMLQVWCVGWGRDAATWFTSW